MAKTGSGTQGSLPGMETPTNPVFHIVFDGGSLGNPGKGYGSYVITSNDDVVLAVDKMEHGERLTNNQAEYMTLIAALKSLAADLGEHSKLADVEIHGDSQLVVKQINGEWKVKHANMVPLVKEARELFKAFRSCIISWHPRAKSVERLGH
jgi:ribonuclease HI